jgi:hypothetical protein
MSVSLHLSMRAARCCGSSGSPVRFTVRAFNKSPSWPVTVTSMEPIAGRIKFQELARSNCTSVQKKYTLLGDSGVLSSIFQGLQGFAYDSELIRKSICAEVV